LWPMLPNDRIQSLSTTSGTFLSQFGYPERGPIGTRREVWRVDRRGTVISPTRPINRGAGVSRRIGHQAARIWIAGIRCWEIPSGTEKHLVDNSRPGLGHLVERAKSFPPTRSVPDLCSFQHVLGQRFNRSRFPRPRLAALYAYLSRPFSVPIGGLNPPPHRSRFR